MSVVKVSWSGGKDSTCAVFLNLFEGHQVKIVHYTPYFTKDIPLIRKEHFNYIVNMMDLFRSLGADVYHVTGITYYEYVTRIIKRGKNKGKIYGFPLPQVHKCGFNGKSKSYAVNNCDVGFYDWIDIGIAYDEYNRYGVLRDCKRSILQEKAITELDAYNLCLDYNVLSPIYLNSDMRDGCALCYNASERVRQLWYKDYPEAVPILRDLQLKVFNEFPLRTPLRNYEWFFDPFQISMF